MTPRDALAALWRDLDLPTQALDAVALTGGDPVLPSSFRIGTAAQVTIAAVAAAAAELHRRRTGVAQTVAVDMRHAAAEFRSERCCRVNGAAPSDPWDKIAGAYRCRDGWVRLHTNFPHHRDGVLALLRCDYDKAAVARALEDWSAEEFETQATFAGLVVAAQRSFAAWDSHPQGIAMRGLPLVAVERIGDAPAARLQGAARPLEGIRVLDLTRIIAGPVAGRALAAHGAEVLRLIAPTLATIHSLDVDTGRGKRSAYCDIGSEEGRATLRALVAEADIVVQSYRPGALAARGFGPQDLARLRPGLVVVSLSAYGHTGPWAQKRGFDSLVQTATGFNVAEAEAGGSDTPRPLPAQALDHASGYLLALGAVVGLMRQIDQGGSWLVRASLAGTGAWLRGLGRVANGFGAGDPSFEGVGDLLEVSSSGYGELTAIRHAAAMSVTQPRWAHPSVPFGTNAPSWAA